jgi:hypothetical protein
MNTNTLAAKLDLLSELSCSLNSHCSQLIHHQDAIRIRNRSDGPLLSSRSRRNPPLHITRPILFRFYNNRSRHPSFRHNNPLRPRIRAALQMQHTGYPERLSRHPCMAAEAVLGESCVWLNDKLRAYQETLYGESYDDQPFGEIAAFVLVDPALLWPWLTEFDRVLSQWDHFLTS